MPDYPCRYLLSVWDGMVGQIAMNVIHVYRICSENWANWVHSICKKEVRPSRSYTTNDERRTTSEPISIHSCPQHTVVCTKTRTPLRHWGIEGKVYWSTPMCMYSHLHLRLWVMCYYCFQWLNFFDIFLAWALVFVDGVCMQALNRMESVALMWSQECLHLICFFLSFVLFCRGAFRLQTPPIHPKERANWCSICMRLWLMENWLKSIN